MYNEERVSQLIEILGELSELSGSLTPTRIFPNLTVVDNAPSGLSSDYILIEDDEGYYVPALKVPGVSYANSDKVNVLFIRGTEPIAFQQGSGSSGSNATPHNILSATHLDTLPDTVIAGDLIYGNATPKWARLPKGAHADGEVLTLVAGAPDWAATSGGGNVWPKVGKVNISSTEYATFALANTAAAGGDELLVGAGTNVCENVQAKDGIYISGTNPEDTLLSATASLQTIKQAAATNTLTVKGVTFKTSYNPGASSTTYGLDASNLVARNCNFDSTNLYNNALGHAAAIGSSVANNTPIRTLVDCKLKARKTHAGATSIGLDATYGTWILEGGEIDAEDYAVNVSSINVVVELRGTKIIQGTINVISGSIRGWYCDSVGNIWVLPGSAINFAAGVWLTDISRGLIINEATFPTALAAADDGDTIKFDTGTYTLSSTQNIAKSITIEGEGLDATIINFTGSNQAAFDLTTDSTTITFRNLTLNHTGGGTAATGVFSNNAITFILDNAQVLIPSGSPTDARPLWMEAGTWELRNGAKAKSTSGTNKYGIYNDAGAVTVNLGAGCILEGATANIYSDQSGSTFNFDGVALLNNIMDCAGVVTGFCLDSKYRNAGFVALNNSGGTRAAGDVCDIDSAGKLTTTTTAQVSLSWTVVAIGNTNGNPCFVRRQGRVTCGYTGTDPSAGHFLVTSTSAGLAQRQTTMHYAIFAVCTAAGSGGLVEAELLCNTTFVPLTTTVAFYTISNTGDAIFTGTINGVPSATSFVYAVTTGNENAIGPDASTDLAKLMFYNSTRSTYRLVTANNTGTNTVTNVSVADSWANGDTLTLANATINDGLSPPFVGFDLSQQTTVPILARAVIINAKVTDSGGAGATVQIHPYMAYNSSQNLSLVQSTQGTSTLTAPFFAIPLINQKFGMRADAVGTSGLTRQIVLSGYFVAAP